MRIAVLGTGMVGKTIANKLVSHHQVKMGSRTAHNERAEAWAAEAGDNASTGTFAEAAAFGEIVFNCTLGIASLDALRAAGAENLARKILLDLSNPLDFSQGFPPRLSICNDDSLGETIQREFPDTKVVKTLNTMANSLMVNPELLPEEHEVFVSGNDADAKAEVVTLLRKEFGWKSVTDLGDITTSRGTEAWLLLWTRLYGSLGHGNFNLRLVGKH